MRVQLPTTPRRSARPVFEHDPFIEQDFADAIGFVELLFLFGGRSHRDQQLNAGGVIVRTPQKLLGILLQQSQRIS